MINVAVSGAAVRMGQTVCDAVEAAADCELELVIAALPIEDRQFEVRALCEYELVLALPTGHQLAHQRSCGRGIDRWRRHRQAVALGVGGRHVAATAR